MWDEQLWCARMILPVGVRGDVRSGCEDSAGGEADVPGARRRSCRPGRMHLGHVGAGSAQRTGHDCRPQRPRRPDPRGGRSLGGGADRGLPVGDRGQPGPRRGPRAVPRPARGAPCPGRSRLRLGRGYACRIDVAVGLRPSDRGTLGRRGSGHLTVRFPRRGHLTVRIPRRGHRIVRIHRRGHLTVRSPDAGTSPTGSPGAGTSTAPDPPDAGTSPTGSPGAGTASSGSPKPGASSVVAELAAAESAAQAQRATACDGAQDPGLARDLCLIAASEAQHAAALDDLGERRAGS